MAHIFNLSLELNIVPDIWNSAPVVPLLKGGDPTRLDNYRPISKLSVIAKTLESIVSKQLKVWLIRIRRILGPLLFPIYINNLSDNQSDASIHLYADDTTIYYSASSIDRCISKLQEAFEIVQRNLLPLKLVLNYKKTK